MGYQLNMILSPQQDRAMVEVDRWMRDPNAPQVKYVAGYAGTGKTTLAKRLVQGATSRWLFAAYTGKASHVLRQKGCDGASTIHSLIYRPAGESKKHEMEVLDLRIYSLQQQIKAAADVTSPEFDPVKFDQLNKQLSVYVIARSKLLSENKLSFTLWANSPLNEIDIGGIVIDEVSMVDQYLAQDLESFGKKILVLGDPAQLPPVGAGGYYTKRTPDVMLTEVHRHALDSGILRLATSIREGGRVADFDIGSSTDVEIIEKMFVDRDELATQVLAADQVLCGLNATRHRMNRRHRELLGRIDTSPVDGDRLVCLRNNKADGLFNGSQWVVRRGDADVDARTGIFDLQSEEDDGRMITDIHAWLHHFLGLEDELKQMEFGRRDLNEFDYSYAMTVHKSQGSQWNNVMVFDESRSFRTDARKWLYTGVTRAAKTLKVVV